MNKIGCFTKQDIRELCPALSLSSIEGALRKLVESGELKREGYLLLQIEVIPTNNRLSLKNNHYLRESVYE